MATTQRDFDQVQTVSRSTVLFNEKTERLIGGELEVGMDQTLGEYARGAAPAVGDTNIRKQVHSTFHVDFSNLPNDVGEAGIYDVRVNVRPKKNLHFFSGQSYYPTDSVTSMMSLELDSRLLKLQETSTLDS